VSGGVTPLQSITNAAKSQNAYIRTKSAQVKEKGQKRALIEMISLEQSGVGIIDILKVS
jgi:hypothetical protein